MATKKNRKNERTEVALVARYRSPTAFDFVAEDCADLSTGGMFIRSQHPAPPGTLLKLECDVDQGKATIRAVARVVWLREDETEGGPKGMGVKFVKLEPGSREVIQAVLDNPGLRNSFLPGEHSFSAPALIAEAEAEAAARASEVPRDVTHEPPAQVRADGVTEVADEGPVFFDDAAPAGAAPVGAFGTDTAAAASDDGFGFGEAEAASDIRPVMSPVTGRTLVMGSVRAPVMESEGDRPPSERPPSERPASEPPADAEQEDRPSYRPRRTGAEGLRERLRQSKLFDDLHRRPSESPSSAPPEAPETHEATHGVSAAFVHAEPAAASADVVSAEGGAPGAERLYISTAGDLEAAAAEERLDSLPPDVPKPERVSRRTKIIVGSVAAWAVILGVIATREPSADEKAKVTPAAEAAKAPAPPPAPAPEPAPVAEPTPVVPVQPEGALQEEQLADPEAQVAQPSALPLEYVLDVVTMPAGARVSAGGQTVTSPGQLRLGLLEAPVQIAASKQGYVRVVSTIDRREFQQQGDEMRGTLTLALVEENAQSAQPVPPPAPKPERPKAVAAAPKPAPAPAPAPAPVPAPAPSVAPAPDGVRTVIETNKKKPAEPGAVAETSPLDVALACLSKGDNECVIAALDGKTRTPRELELLIETYRATGRSAKAEQLMETYVRRFPDQRRAATYQRMLETE